MRGLSGLETNSGKADAVVALARGHSQQTDKTETPFAVVSLATINPADPSAASL